MEKLTGENSMTKKPMLFSMKRMFDEFCEEYSKEPFVQALFRCIPLMAMADAYFGAKSYTVLKEKVETFIQDVNQKLKQRSDLIDNDFLESDEFACLSYATLQKVATTHQREKIKLFSNIIANSTTVKYSEVEYKEQFLKIVDDLDPIHIQVLKFVNEKIGEKPVNIQVSRGTVVSLDEINKHVAPGFTVERLESVCKELVNYNLLLDASGVGYGGYSPGRYFLAGFASEFLEFIFFESDE
jgi:hypothetical protein